MATYAPQTATHAGVTTTWHTAAAGDKISGVQKTATMLINNAGASSITATISPPGTTSYGVDNPDKVITVGAGAIVAVSLFPTYRDPDDSNLVAPTWSDATSVTWAVLI